MANLVSKLLTVVCLLAVSSCAFGGAGGTTGGSAEVNSTVGDVCVGQTAGCEQEDDEDE